MTVAVALALLACLGTAAAQPFLPGTGFAPLGNLRTTDQDGPYSLEYVPVQVAEIQAGLAARDGFTALDAIHFLTNTECLEGRFDTYGTFGRDFTGNLTLGGEPPQGLRKANLTERTRPYLEEIALIEQGHTLLTRHLGSALPCPYVDYDAGFNGFLAAAYELPAGQTIEQAFGAPFDPFLNDVNFVLCVLSLEEVGATGGKGLALLVDNPVHANAIAGLAAAANAQAAVELCATAWSPQFDDQGLVNTDPRYIAGANGINMVSTDVHGTVFARTPQQVINIQTLGAPDGKGGFYPKGLVGKIRLPTGYNRTVPGTDDYPRCSALTSPQEPTQCLGNIPPPVTAAGPANVEGELQLTQTLGGPKATAGPENRGLNPVPMMGSVNNNGPPVKVGVSPCLSQPQPVQIVAVGP